MCRKGLITLEAYVAPAAFSMERRAGREEAQGPVASLLVERMRAHVETFGMVENHNKM